MTTYGPRRPVVLQVREPSMGMIQLGKVATTTQGWAYCNNISAQMRKTGEYGIAPCVVDLMDAWNLDTVLYYDRPKNTTWRVTLYGLKHGAKLHSYGGRPLYWYLPSASWYAHAGMVPSVFVSEVLLLDWTTPEIAPDLSAKQLSLSF